MTAKRRKKNNSDIIFFIDKKQQHFKNIEKINCVRCTSNNIEFKNKWELIPHVNEWNLIANVKCRECNYQFMDNEWDK